jgi:Copper transport outer membrane protein, MctB
VINFRYHVVSLTAVFLALTIGLVLGTTALNGAVADQLKDQVTNLNQKNQELRDQVIHLTDDVESREQFAVQAAPAILGNKLSGIRVAVLFASSGGEYVDGVVEMLSLAGARVTGQVEIKDKFTDPAHNDELLDLAHTSLRPSITGNLPTNTNGVEASAALLAAVLLVRAPTVSADDLKFVLTAYSSQGYLAIRGDVTGPAEAVVIVAGPPATDAVGGDRNTNLLTTASQFDQAGQVVVVANNTAGAGNLVAAVRSDPNLSKNISTVDNLATPFGRIVTPLAVAEQLAGRVGAYGTGSGATLLPKLKQ